MVKICELCGKEFPLKKEINGKIRNLQRRKYCLECSPFKEHNTKQLHIKENGKFCICCGKPLIRRQTKYCSKNCKAIVYISKRRRKIKKKMVDYKGGKCIKCGYNKCIWALEFHHREKKNFSLTKAYTKKWQQIKKELDKCDLVCANCHREIAFEKFKY